MLDSGKGVALMGWFIVSARREETRLARLEILIEACEKGKRLR